MKAKALYVSAAIYAVCLLLTPAAFAGNGFAPIRGIAAGGCYVPSASVVQRVYRAPLVQRVVADDCYSVTEQPLILRQQVGYGYGALASPVRFVGRQVFPVRRAFVGRRFVRGGVLPFAGRVAQAVGRFVFGPRLGVRGRVVAVPVRRR